MFAATNWSAVARGLPPVEQLSDRGTGICVVDHRSSWVRRVASSQSDVFIKTYQYASWGRRLGNWGKWTAPTRPSRAAREWQALTWLRANGFAATEPLACLEWRQFGFLAQATLLTAAYDGEAADCVLPESSTARQRQIAIAIGRLVGALHRLGFRDRNLDLRNLLVQQRDDNITIAKIDSPRFRLVRPGDHDDRLCKADWQRLLPQLAELQLAELAYEAR